MKLFNWIEKQQQQQLNAKCEWRESDYSKFYKLNGWEGIL